MDPTRTVRDRIQQQQQQHHHHQQQQHYVAMDPTHTTRYGRYGRYGYGRFFSFQITTNVLVKATDTIVIQMQLVLILEDLSHVLASQDIVEMELLVLVRFSNTFALLAQLL